MKFSYKVILLWTLFICIDIALAAGFTEVWIRAFIPVKNICYYHDPVLGDMFCPNQETYGYVEKGYANIFKNNSLGFHDRERSKEKKSGVIRIHIYGDSLTAAAGVPINKTIPSLLETYLLEKYPNSQVEVVNMASAEDSTPAEYLTYKRIGRDFSPDIVICYFMNDFHDNILETHYRTRSPYYGLDKTGKLFFIPPVPVDLTTPWEKFKRASRLYRLMANKFLSSKLYHDINQYQDKLSLLFQEEQNISTTEVVKDRNYYLKNKAWPVTLKLLIKFRDEVNKEGGIFILVDGYPIREETAGGFTNKSLETFCKKNSIKYIPAYKEYLEFKHAEDRHYFLLDAHPTSLGNEKLTEILLKKLPSVLPENYFRKNDQHEKQNAL